jgi:hypothetical protein
MLRVKFNPVSVFIRAIRRNPCIALPGSVSGVTADATSDSVSGARPPQPVTGNSVEMLRVKLNVVSVFVCGHPS